MAFFTFVAMPFGIKQGIDFNRVFREYIEPALTEAHFEVFRADEEMRAGNIRTDMFQQLLIADLVVVDLSIDNPNVWYELGVRHALRSRGVIQIVTQREQMPFDVYTDRMIRYHTKDGVPDPEFLQQDKAKLAQFATETMASWHGRKVSPVYHLLSYLKEPDWKSLRVGEAQEFWERYERWEERIEIARDKRRPGDIMLLADEAPTQALHLDAHRAAGKALMKMGQFSFALGQYKSAFAIDPTDLDSQQQTAILLGRTNRYEEARVKIDNLVEKFPNNAECWSLKGRIAKEAWAETWRKSGRSTAEMRAMATDEIDRLEESIEAYKVGFTKDPNNFYTGINAVGLSYLHEHLTGSDTATKDRKAMEGGVRWVVRCARERDSSSYWARATLADLAVLSAPKKEIERAYKDAVAVNTNWFALDSTWQQLTVLRDLEFRPEEVNAAITIMEREINRLKPPWQPRTTILFSGHMIDKPDRPKPRFPDGKSALASGAILNKLNDLGATEQDLAVTSAACGGDLLFAELCLDRGMTVHLYLAFDEPEFLERSVNFAGEEWKKMYFRVRDHPKSELFTLTEELGPGEPGANQFARNNVRMLYNALALGTDRVRFIALWDGQEGDGPGGTKHMIETVKQHLGQVWILDTKQIFA
jgi:tetratricopeptide (TPR) repeat protein